MKKNIFAFALSVIALTGCQELFGDETKPDGSNPNIVISAPADNSSFTSSQKVEIHSTINDKDNVQKFEVRVTKVGNDASAPAWGFSKQPNKKIVVRIDTAFAASALAAGNYVLTFNSVDGRTNVATKEIKFSIK